MMRSTHFVCLAVTLLGFCLSANAAVPLQINHQGYVFVNAKPYSGPGTFKFVIFDGASTIVWTNDGTKVGAGAGTLGAANAPTSGVPITVDEGRYALDLGDTSLTNMVGLSTDDFDSDELYLRVFFDDGTNGEIPVGDERIGSSAFAMRAGVADVAISAQTLNGLTEDDPGLTGYLHGGVISNASGDVANDLSISAVVCRDDSDTVILRVPAMTKRVDSTWTQGSNAGGLDMGTVGGTRVIVYVWAIGDSTGSNPPDYLFSKSATAPEMPSGYDVTRLIGGREWNETQWRLFRTYGNDRTKLVRMSEPVELFTSTSSTGIPTYQAVDISAYVPTATSLLPDIRFSYSDDGSSTTAWIQRIGDSNEIQVLRTSGTARDMISVTHPVELNATGEYEHKTVGGDIFELFHHLDSYTESL